MAATTDGHELTPPDAEREAGEAQRSQQPNAHPSLAERLDSPLAHRYGAEEAPGGLRAAHRADPATPREAMTPPPFPRFRREPRPKPLKAVEWFFSAIGHLGRTYRRAKLADRDLEMVETRVIDLDTRSLALEARSDGAEGGLADAMARLEALDTALSAIQNAESARREAAAESARLAAHLAERLSGLEDRLARLAEEAAVERAMAARAHTTLARRLDTLRHAGAEAGEAAGEAAGGHTADEASGRPPEPSTPTPAESLTLLLESFYHRLEARFRGSREEIQSRLAPYLVDAEAAVARTCLPKQAAADGEADPTRPATRALPVLDLGCGRGEWLELLARRGIAAYGVDTNPLQAEEGRALGLDIRLEDAIAHLEGLAPGSLAMVSAHHLVEHLPFALTARLVQGAMVALAPGGLLLLETPNAHALLVSARSFHVDPTHLRLLPEEVLTVLAETVGFHPVETRALHPHEALARHFREGRIDPELAGLIFGPQDLALLATKPDMAARKA